MTIRAVEIDEAARLFRQGKSKNEIAKLMGLDKKKVGKLLARAANANNATKGEPHGND